MQRRLPREPNVADPKEVRVVLGGGGIGLGGVLTIIFTLAKLMGIINWSWIWVLCPLWFWPAIFVGALIGLFFFALGVAVVESIMR
jgi:hypothetical protein